MAQFIFLDCIQLTVLIFEWNHCTKRLALKTSQSWHFIDEREGVRGEDRASYNTKVIKKCSLNKYYFRVHEYLIYVQWNMNIEFNYFIIYHTSYGEIHAWVQFSPFDERSSHSRGWFMVRRIGVLCISSLFGGWSSLLSATSFPHVDKCVQGWHGSACGHEKCQPWRNQSSCTAQVGWHPNIAASEHCQLTEKGCLTDNWVEAVEGLPIFYSSSSWAGISQQLFWLMLFGTGQTS